MSTAKLSKCLVRAMLSEIVKSCNQVRARYGDGPITIDDILLNIQEGGSRGSFLLRYKHSIRGGFMYSYAEFFRELAERAIRMWSISEGKNTITVGRDTPRCDGGVCVEPPIMGTTASVIAILFAKKMASQNANYDFNGSTEDALAGNPAWWQDVDWRIELARERGRPEVTHMGAVYYSGSLFVTRDRKKFRLLCDMAYPRGV